MAAIGDSEVPVVEQPAAEAPATEQSKQAEETVKEKKPKQPKNRFSSSLFSGFRQTKLFIFCSMIKEALMALNEKNGSSPYAIAKYMEEKHKLVLPVNFRKILGLQLKNSAARGKLIKIKASYKLSGSEKKDKGTAKVAKVNTEKKPKQGKAAAPKAKPVKKPGTTKKAAKPAKKTRKSASAKPRQPKSIKSPAAKKPKKATA